MIVVAVISKLTGSVTAYVVHYIFNIFLFYIHAYTVLPRVFKKRAQVFWRLPLTIIVEVAVYFVIVYFVDYILLRYLHLMPEISLTIDTLFIVKAIYRAVYFIGVSTGYYFLITFIKERTLNEKLEKQKLIDIIDQQKVKNELNVAVNAYLKAQINPHFLFNTLSFIYNNIRKTSPKAAEAIITLSDMMRYAIESENSEGLVLLSEEVEQLRNLILLHQIRQDDTLYLRLEYSPGTSQTTFIPLVLLTLAENIFKHGNLSRASRPATISVRITQANLQITTANLINEGKGEISHHLGLENIRQRLLHTYGEKASIIYSTDTDHYFHVNVTLSYH